jgi:hypothetical protein
MEKTTTTNLFSSRTIIKVGVVIILLSIYVVYFASRALNGNGWEREVSRIVGDHEKYFSPEVGLYLLAGCYGAMLLLNITKVTKMFRDRILNIFGSVLLLAFVVVNALTLLYSYNTNNTHAIEKGWQAFWIPAGLAVLRKLPALWAKYDRLVDRLIEKVSQK